MHPAQIELAGTEPTLQSVLLVALQSDADTTPGLCMAADQTVRSIEGGTNETHTHHSDVFPAF
jgi:hypothetical protein